MKNFAFSPLTAVSPIDGRYQKRTASLAPYFSEFGLINYRVRVEVEYLIALSHSEIAELTAFSKDDEAKLRKIYLDFSLENAQKIKEIEQTTNHDVKAVEYFLKEETEKNGVKFNKEFIHFGLTSQDINNTAIPLSIKEADEQILMPKLEQILELTVANARAWKNVPMLARTHGQSASPTSLGKEFMVFAERLFGQISVLKNIPYSAKFGGATGNLNAHFIAYPNTDWISFSNQFVNEILGLKRGQFTTQIEHYDTLAAHFDAMKRINTILIDFSRDVWTYISLDYFKQKTKSGEIGSSAMPHKVNPIDFENAEGNLGIANAILEHLSAKLPISRLQRDLTDSTVLRNVGMPYAHILIALDSLEKGIGKLLLNEKKINDDLEANWAVIAEAIQTVLRASGVANPYELLKDLTRGNEINKATIQTFIENLNVSEAIKTRLRAITPQNYIGKNPEF